MKRLLLATLFAVQAFAAGTVQQSLSQLGSSNSWVVAFNWTADGSGSVPITASQGMAGCCQGYNIVQVETVPGTPSPTGGYAVAINDSAGVDALAGAGASLSASVAQSFAASTASPPIQGSFSLVITGQSVAGAKGQVYVFLSKPGTVSIAALGRGAIASSPNWLTIANAPFVDARVYSFAPQSPGGSLAAGNNTVIFRPLPAGVTASDVNHRLYVSGGTGAAESCLINGGSGNAIQINCANTHTGAWTIQSATSGIYEAIVAQSYAGLVYVPCGTWNLYASLYLPRLMGLSGNGECSVLSWSGPTSGIALISGDTTSTDSTEYLPVVQNIEIVNNVAAGTTVGVLAGGDPSGVRASASLLGGRVTFEHVLLRGFNTQLLYGTNAYNRNWIDVRFDGASAGNFGVQFGIPTTGFGGNSGTHEVFTDSKFIANMTAAIQTNSAVSATFNGTRVEYNRRGFYINDGVGSTITWQGGHMETYSDNAASTFCSLANVCGPFIEFQSLSNLSMNILGGDYFYADPAVTATNYFNFSNVFRLGLNVQGAMLGAAAGATVTNAMSVSSTDPAHSSVNVALLHYSQGFEPALTKIVNTSTLTLWRVTAPDGHSCYNCPNPDTGTAIAVAKLPAAGATTEGLIIPVLDSSTDTWGATVTGLGSFHVGAYCDGTNWTVGVK